MGTIKCCHLSTHKIATVPEWRTCKVESLSQRAVQWNFHRGQLLMDVDIARVDSCNLLRWNACRIDVCRITVFSRQWITIYSAFPADSMSRNFHPCMFVPLINLIPFSQFHVSFSVPNIIICSSRTTKTAYVWYCVANKLPKVKYRALFEFRVPHSQRQG